jgi:C1A family cysteine protease
MNQRFLNIIGIVIPGVLLSLTSTLVAQTCQPQYVLGSNQLYLPCIDWLSDPKTRTVYQAELVLTDPEALLFQWVTTIPLAEPSPEVGAIFEPNSKNLYIPFIEVQTAPTVITPYQVTLQEGSGGVLSIIQAIPLPDPNNHPPTVTPVSIQINPSLSYQKVQLTGSDPDGDTLAFELIAPSQGEGYTVAYITSNNILYIMVKSDFRGEIKLPYRATDGRTFSQSAAVTITVTDSKMDEEFFFGSKEVSAREFAGMRTLRLRAGGSNLSSSSETDGQADLPSKVDLSAQFPTPGYQGKQNSCIAWSIAYAVKSYQEVLEKGWSLDTKDHLFSPAFIYNSMNNGMDNGLKVNEALDWTVDNGVATLATMPYQESDSTTQPTIAAIQEAQSYKPQEWGTLKSNKDIKTSLANNQPVIITMAAFNSFKSLKGTDSVYNTADTWVGEHAVTVVGYDDGHASGGAFKVMNSWGTDWGDQGFFWLPYQFTYTQVQIEGEDTGSLISGAYVVVDQENITRTVAVQPPPTTNGTKLDFPNLMIKDLQIQVSYEQLQSGIGGKLQYTIENLGVVSVPAESAWVDLILSKNPNLSRPDYQHDPSPYYFLKNQMISSELAAGQAVTQTIESFTIPPAISSGEYYLYLTVDAFDKANDKPMDETDKSDNIKKVMENPLLFFNKEGSPITKDLPNLAIKTWQANYDTFQPGAQGELQYTVANTDLGTVPANSAWVGLILSKNPKLRFNDYYYDEFYLLAGEMIESELATGDGKTRDENNVLSFSFPSELSSAQYYLYLVVDAHDKVHNQSIIESDYQDNISVADATKTLLVASTTPLPDLVTDFWFVEWNHQTGEGKLDYAIKNTGVTAAQVGWNISLVLSSLERFDSQGKPQQIVLWQKPIDQILEAGFDPIANPPSIFYVTQDNPVPINVYQDLNDKPVPPGSYDLIFQLDSNNTVKEYDENNDFYSGIIVEMPRLLPPPPNGVPRRKGEVTQQAYNGKRLLKARLNNSDRQRSKSVTDLSEHIFSKTIRSSDQLIFPIERLTPMPPVKNNQKK